HHKQRALILLVLVGPLLPGFGDPLTCHLHLVLQAPRYLAYDFSRKAVLLERGNECTDLRLVLVGTRLETFGHGAVNRVHRRDRALPFRSFAFLALALLTFAHARF